MATPGVSRRRTLAGLAGVGVGLPVLAACGDDEPATATDDGPASSGSPSESPSPTQAESSSGAEPPAAGALAATADIPVGGGAVFADAGVVVTQPEAGTFQGFSVVCTHAGCPVNQVTSTINCPCHGSKFSIVDGVPVAGSSATEPLEKIALDVAGDQITLA